MDCNVYNVDGSTFMLARIIGLDEAMERYWLPTQPAYDPAAFRREHELARTELQTVGRYWLTADVYLTPFKAKR